MMKLKVSPLVAVVVKSVSGCRATGTGLNPWLYGKGVDGGKAGKNVMCVPSVKTLKLPVFAPAPPFTAPSVPNVIVEEVNESLPWADNVPEIGSAKRATGSANAAAKATSDLSIKPPGEAKMRLPLCSHRLLTRMHVFHQTSSRSVAR